MGLIRHLHEIGHETAFGVQLRDLSDMLKISLPAISKKIKTLEEKGYVERTVDPKDRRIAYVRLTAQGNAAVEKTQELINLRSDKICKKLGEEESAQLIVLLNKMKTCIQEVLIEEEELLK